MDQEQELTGKGHHGMLGRTASEFLPKSTITCVEDTAEVSLLSLYSSLL